MLNIKNDKLYTQNINPAMYTTSIGILTFIVHVTTLLIVQHIGQHDMMITERYIM